MTLFQRFLVITGALLIVAAMVAHIVCLATPNLARMGFESYVKSFNQTLQEMNASGHGQVYNVSNVQRQGELNPASFGADGAIHFGVWTVCIKGTVDATTRMDACFPWDSYFPNAGTWGKPGWVNTVKGFYIAGLVLAVLSVILSNTNAHTPSQGDRGRILPILICFTSLLAGVIVLIGNLVVACNYTKDFSLPFFDQLDTSERALFDQIWEKSLQVSWGFALGLTSALVFILAGLFHVLAGRAARREDKIRRQEELMKTPMPNYEEAPL